MVEKTATPDYNNRNALQGEEVYEIERHSANFVGVNQHIVREIENGLTHTSDASPELCGALQDVRERLSVGDYNGAAQIIDDYRGPWLENTMDRGAFVHEIRGGAASWALVSSALANDGASASLLADYHSDALANGYRGNAFIGAMNILQTSTGTTERDAALVAAAGQAHEYLRSNGGIRGALSMENISYNDVASGAHASALPVDKSLGGRNG